MKTFKEWFEENFPGEKIPEGQISGTWFAMRRLPVIVSCTNCGTTMCIVNAMVDEEGDVFCPTCVGE